MNFCTYSMVGYTTVCSTLQAVLYVYVVGSRKNLAWRRPIRDVLCKENVSLLIRRVTTKHPMCSLSICQQDWLGLITWL